jgi:hypothetical protein
MWITHPDTGWIFTVNDDKVRTGASGLRLYERPVCKPSYLLHSRFTWSIGILLSVLYNSDMTCGLRPNVVVEWLTSLRIWKVPESNLGPENGYPEWGFSWFSLVSAGKCQDSSLKLGHYQVLPNPFQFIVRLFFHSTLCSLSYWKSVVKWTTRK